MKKIQIVIFLTSFIFAFVPLGLSQGLGGPEGCEGGSCTYVRYVGGYPVESCDACCPEGKTPWCSSFGCDCNVF